MTELDPVCDYSHVVSWICGPFPKRLISLRFIPMIPRTPMSELELPSLSACIWHCSDMNDTDLDPGVVLLELKNDPD